MNPPTRTEQTAGSQESATLVTESHRWAIVGLLFTASMINYMDRATLSFALPLISRDLRLEPMTQGILLSAFFWSYALMQIPIGYFADRVNLRHEVAAEEVTLMREMLGTHHEDTFHLDVLPRMTIVRLADSATSGTNAPMGDSKRATSWYPSSPATSRS